MGIPLCKFCEFLSCLTSADLSASCLCLGNRDVKGNRRKQEEFEINPERNHGLNYAYQNVERRKEERKKMMGHGCIECENVRLPAGNLRRSER